MFFSPFLSIATNGAALYVATRFVPEIIYSGGWLLFVVGGLFLGLANFLIKPLLKLAALPLIFITGGLFTIVINIFILWLLSYILDTAQFYDLSINFSTIAIYIKSAIVLGLANWILSLID